MKSFKNLTIIGTSHIAVESVREVEDYILKQKPNIIALELDKKRFFSLLHPEEKASNMEKIKHLGIRGWLINIIGSWIQKKLGKAVGMMPGAEMKKAIELSRELKIDIALIDQDIEITMRKLSKEITFREKLKFIYDLTLGLIFKGEKIKIDLTKVPEEELIKKLTKKLKERYPSLYKILISERNSLMAKNLYNLINKSDNKPILAIVGAGHESDLITLIKKYDKKH